MHHQNNCCSSCRGSTSTTTRADYESHIPTKNDENGVLLLPHSHDDHNNTTYDYAGRTSSPSASSSSNVLLLDDDEHDQLRSFRISLKWCALDHSSALQRFISYSTFIFLTIIVPMLYSLSDVTIRPYNSIRDVEDPNISFNKLVQIPESALASIAFLTLARFFRRYSLRQLLFLDGLQEDSVFVRHGYSRELHKAFRCLASILFPCLVVEFAHKMVFFFSTVKIGCCFHNYNFITTTTTTTVAGAGAAAAAVSCVSTVNSGVMIVLLLASWIYRTGLFLLVCVLFRLTCALQILRFEGLHNFFDFQQDLEGIGSCTNYKSAVIFKEHRRIKEQLSLTSHRYRFFIIASLVTITITQLGAMLLVLAFKTDKTFLNSGDLLVCCAVQLSGFLLCLVGAARITHRAQRVAGIASKWNMKVTSAPSSGSGSGDQGKGLVIPAAVSKSNDCSSRCAYYQEYPRSITNQSSQSDILISFPSHCQDPSSFQTRQALVAYLQHNSGGITLFGFALDRGLLHTLFAFEFSLVLWILSKVVVLS